jgi:hypothetical protein
LFYSKAKALEQLSAFFDACAQVEIDDYRDYEKALAALRESHEWMGKARGQGKEAKVAQLATRIAHIEMFVSARKMVRDRHSELASGLATAAELLPSGLATAPRHSSRAVRRSRARWRHRVLASRLAGED